MMMCTRIIKISIIYHPEKMNFSGLKVVVDCANGSAYKVAPEIFSEVGINLIRESVKPDGKNINKKNVGFIPKKSLKIGEEA